MRAKYKIVYMNEGVIALVDCAGERTITEDIHSVIFDLQVRIDIGERRIVYRDSAGIWDEIVLNQHGDFAEVNMLAERHLGQVLARMC